MDLWYYIKIGILTWIILSIGIGIILGWMFKQLSSDEEDWKAEK